MTTSGTRDGEASASLEPGGSPALLDELTGTLDALLDEPLARAGLFGAPAPVVGDRFRITGRLGEGATAVVYAARDTTLDRPVAIKLIARRDADGAWRERVLREARALASLRHPRVAAVYDVGEWRGHPFIAMELVTGVTLAAWQVAQPRPWHELVRRYLAAAHGLDAAHAAGLVHRDFKPENVMVDGERVVVTDFGLAIPAAPTGEDLGARPSVGTPAYRAPEQHAGAPPQPTADVYSFSVALCEALIGRHPLIEREAGARPPGGPAFNWRRALAQTPLPPRARMAIEHGMAPEPAQRWPRLGPLLAELERALPPRPRWIDRLCRRFGRPAAGALLALTAALAATADGQRTAPPPRDTSAYVEIARGLQREDPTAGAVILAAVPREQRGAGWIEAVRALLLRPIAREVQCSDGAPRAPARASVAHGLLAAVDDGGRASVCELATWRAAPLAEGARCARVLDRAHVGVITVGGELAVFAARGPGWQLERRLPLASTASALGGDSPCKDELRLLGPGVLALRGDGDGDGDGSQDHWRYVDLGRAPALRAEREAAGEALDRDARRAPPLTADLGPLLSAGVPQIAVDPASGVGALLTADGGVVIDLASGRVRRRDRLALPGPPGVMAIAPGGRAAVAVVGRGLLLWWPLDGARPTRLEAVSENVTSQLELSPSGARLVWLNSVGGAGVRDVGGAGEHELPAGGRPLCHVTFVTDDRVAAMTCDGRVLEWDLAAARSFVAGRHDLAHCAPGCAAAAGVIWMAAAAPDGSVIATAGRDGTVGLWPTRGAGEPARLPLGAGARAFQVAFSDDLLLVTAHGETAQLWRWRTGELAATLPGHEGWSYAAAIARAPTGEARLVTGSRGTLGAPGTVRFWRADGTLLSADPVRTAINDLAVSPDGALVAAATVGGGVAIYDATTGARRAWAPAHRGWARRVVFLDDGELLSAGDDGRIVRIAAGTGRILATIPAHEDRILDLDLDRRRGRLLTASVDGTIRLWDLRSGARVRTYAGHRLPVQTVRWHPDGARFVSGDGDLAEPGRPEGAACVWRVDRDTCEDWLIGHRHAIRSAQFLDGERVMTASYDGTVRIWRPPPPATAGQLGAELARRAPACLDERQRISYLSEPAATAVARAAACRALALRAAGP